MSSDDLDERTEKVDVNRAISLVGILNIVITEHSISVNGYSNGTLISGTYEVGGKRYDKAIANMLKNLTVNYNHGD